MSSFDERLPRLVVVTVRSDDRDGWTLEIDGPDLDPWQIAAYLREAATIAEAHLDQLGSSADDEE